MVTSSNSQRVLTDVSTVLHEHYGRRLREVVLFGSRAREDSTEGSDFDILVILNDAVDPRNERKAIGDVIYDLCWEHDAVITCHFVSANRYLYEQSPLFLNARREGVALTS